MNLDLFFKRINKTESCWLWTGRLNSRGYGMWDYTGRGTGTTFAHRISWELSNGTVPEGLELDHLCRVRHCVNPDHLEPVTHQENMRRGIWAASFATECVNGHPYTPENTYVHPKRGTRACKECRRRVLRESRRRRREAA